MRVQFEDDDLRRLYEEGDFHLARFGREVESMYRRKVQFIAAAASTQDLYAYRALRFEKLKGDRAGQHSIRLNSQWRLILRLETDDDGQVVVLVEIVDYH